MPNPNFSLDHSLSLLDIDALNEMQQAAIDATEKHDNLVLLSDTGSGKTLAFLLPIIQSLEPKLRTTQAIVIVPSRELALQIESVFRKLQTGMKVTCCYGGHKREIEENSLIEPPAIIIGTAGRLADHIRRGNITTDTIHTLVLDEFDKSLEAGFVEEIGFIISELKGLKKRVLTSATEAVEIPAFVGADDAVRLNFLSGEEKPGEVLTVQQVLSSGKDKIDTLFHLLCHIGSRSAIIFCNHREAVERTSNLLTEKGILNTYYHGALEQRDREVALAKFRNGTINFLVTTDLASRGLDIANIRYIIHYHLPDTTETYTHRNGRTARMDASGTVILMLNEDEKLPAYVTTEVETLELEENAPVPEKPKWTTLFVGAGKKDKLNKVDIVGFLSQKGELKKEDIGLIEVKDFFSFVAVRRSKASHVLQLIKDQKIKGKKVKIHVAK